MNGLQMRDRPTVERQPQMPIDPRIAARWVSVRLDQGRRRHRKAIGALVVASVLVGAWSVARSPVLAVHQVAVRGLGHTGRDAVLASAGRDNGRPMLNVDTGGIRRKVMALPWVAQVKVRRRWPSTIAIDITERSPVAQLPGTDGLPAVVDAEGRVLAVGREASGVLGSGLPTLPTLHGVPLAGPAGTTLLPGAQGALNVLGALRSPPSPDRVVPVAFRVISVTQAGNGTVSALLAPGSTTMMFGSATVLFGSTDQLPAKLLALRSVLAQMVPGAVATIDVRVPDAPVLTDGRNSSSVSTTQRG